MSENGEIYTAGKNFTLPPAVTAWTNSTSDVSMRNFYNAMKVLGQIIWNSVAEMTRVAFI